MENRGLCSTLQSCLNVSRSTTQSCLIAEIVTERRKNHSDPGKFVFLWLYSGTEIDPSTGKGKLSEKVKLNRGKTTEKNGVKNTIYNVRINLDPGFGIPGAFLIRNQNKHEFFLKAITLLQADDNRNIHFSCDSWIYTTQQTNTNRVFFTDTFYLPNKTPEALIELRKEELSSLRGNGNGVRKRCDRIYDYSLYNDIGKTILGGSEIYPYPRKVKTGQPSCYKDPFDVYVPRDERLSDARLSELISNAIDASLNFVVRGDSGHCKSFDEIRDLYNANTRKENEGWILKKMKELVPSELFEMIEIARAKNKNNPVKFPLPAIIAENEFAWKNDKEFGRQMLAGINPNVIKVLKKLPPESKNGARSSITQSHIKKNLDGLTLEQAMQEWRIFILDHHDNIMPFLKKINKKGICAYASRTLLFLKNDYTLKPLAIELSLPTTKVNEEVNRVFLPATKGGTEAALWLSAKSHVGVNDSAHHQLITHWLNTHAVVEPFVIATRRQLSVLHPIYRLLDPHFKEKMHLNALARSLLVNDGGILAKILFTNKISMEYSSEVYKDWRFDEQALPTDLLKRCMAIKDEDNPTGVQLLFEDYPYASDGLEIWAVIQKMVTNFCSLFYSDDETVKSDNEIQAWWSEIRNIGHADKRDETWWYSMMTITDLTKTLTTLIWMVSALHASVNNGQYRYADYPPNRPTVCRKFIPKEGTVEFADFIKDSDKYFLEMLPNKTEMTIGIALAKVLSVRASNEFHLGEKHSHRWRDDERVNIVFLEFCEDIKEVEKRIEEKNKNSNFKNRQGRPRYRTDS